MPVCCIVYVGSNGENTLSFYRVRKCVVQNGGESQGEKERKGGL